MPSLREGLRRGVATRGGIWRYPLERLCEEVAYAAYHFHWPHAEVLKLEHRERAVWVAEIARINKRLNDTRNE